MATDAYPARHFSLTNSEPAQVANLPRLLRRVAAEIERRDLLPQDLLDVVVQQQPGPHGPTWAATVYWSER